MDIRHPALVYFKPDILRLVRLECVGLSLTENLVITTGPDSSRQENIE